MHRSDALALLSAHGFVFVRRRGSHYHFENGYHQRLTVTMRGQQTVPKAAQILRDIRRLALERERRRSAA